MPSTARRLAAPLCATLLLACASANNSPPRGDASSVGGGDAGALDGGRGDGALALRDASSTADGAVGLGDGAPPRDLALGGNPDLAAGKNIGAACARDGECASGLCKPVVAGSGPVCVTRCTAQSDCAPFGATFFCEATTQGSSTGYCIPRSATHCASCVQDSDCGSLAERCVQASGDIAKACHVDCTLAPFDACPPDYTCKLDAQTKTGMCVPSTGVCLDAVGGYCDRVALPQPCQRQNAAGTCSGQRTCMVNNQRYSTCGAMAPQFKMSCNDQDPAGCMELFSPMAANDVNNCGTCGVRCGAGQGCCSGQCVDLGTATNCARCGDTCGGGAACCANACTALTTTANCGACGASCPGVGAAGDNVTCSVAGCTFSCQGEHYDVNDFAGDGCEVLDGDPNVHAQAASVGSGADRPTTTCNDSDSRDSFQGVIDSDARVHENPAVVGWNATTGSAPDWWTRFDTGGTFCQDDFAITFTTTGGGATPCYQLTFYTTNGTWQSGVIAGNGSASFSSGSGSYSDNSRVYWKIEKTCAASVRESVTYTVSYHL